MRQKIGSGAACGLWTWLVYGIVEFALSCAIPLLAQPDVELLRWQWRPIALVFGVYVLFGIIVGGASGAVLAWTGRRKNGDGSRRHQFAAALTLVLAFAANLARAWPLVASEYVALAIAVILGALFAGASVSSVWGERTAFLADPWKVSLLLLAIPWVNRVALIDHSTILRAAVSLLLCSMIVVLAALWHRLGLSRPKRVRWSAAAIAGTATVLLLSRALVPGSTPTVQANQDNSPARHEKPNVLLITMDTVRADHLSLYGYERDTTPHLRDLAREATVYARAIATSDETLTTHASIFTGLYPSWHGAYDDPPDHPYGRPLVPRFITLAQVLRADGYWTGAEIANFGILGSEMGMGRGFSVYHTHRALRLSEVAYESPRPFYLRTGARLLLSSLAVDTDEFTTRCLRAADINRRTFALLDQARQVGPFFLFVNYMDAHGPYVLPAPFNTRFPGRDRHFNTADIWEMTWAVLGGKRHVSEAERAHLVSQYDGGIAYEDEAIGKLLARLRELGLYENTLIIITGDHGETFGEHGLMQHAVGSVYQDLVHVPLLIKYPSQHDRRQSDALVSHVDLMPTVLDLVGVSLPAGVQGRSLRSPGNDSDAVYSEAFPPPSASVLNQRLRGFRRAIFAGSWKLITWTQGPSELYDLAADPGEARNLNRTDDPRATALVDRLQKWAAVAPRKFDQAGKQDKSTVEKLKSLGYVQ
ncbi:MAG TPA: sulfatase-like hydrolase/transferase [Terriglobales bacterium]|nr:sulfatase-like hydrolase/transferase [Terriglobales bacterium]